MRSIWKPGLFFLFSLLLALVFNMPATQLLSRLEIPKNILVSEPDGTLFNGRVGRIGTSQFSVQDLSYRVDFSCLTRLSICYDFVNPDGRFKLYFNPLSQGVELSDLNIEYAIDDLSTLMQQLLVKPSGRLSIQLNKASAINGQLSDLNGSLVWMDAGVEEEPVNLGDYEMLVSGSAGSFEMKISDNNAQLDVAGKGSIKPDGSYRFDINIKTRAGLDSKIKGALDFVARKKGVNQYTVQQSGRLPAQIQAYIAKSAS